MLTEFSVRSYFPRWRAGPRPRKAISSTRSWRASCSKRSDDDRHVLPLITSVARFVYKNLSSDQFIKRSVAVSLTRTRTQSLFESEDVASETLLVQPHDNVVLDK